MTFSAKRLLVAGALAGPLFCSLVLVQASYRQGFSLASHPLSLLAVGHGGWVQTANFIATALLAAAGGFGLYRATGRKSLAVLLSMYGAGLLIAAAFPAPPAKGFPPGTVDTQVITFSGMMHGVGFMLAHLGILIACVVMAAEFRRQGRRGAMFASLLVAIAVPVVMGLGFANEATIGLFFFGLGALTLGWLTLVCVSQLGREGEARDARDGPTRSA